MDRSEAVRVQAAQQIGGSMEGELAFDHVVVGVSDLDAATERLRREWGLEAEVGGVHPHGTKNRAVRFGDGSYVELLAVDDPSKPLGAWLADAISQGERLIAWAVRSTDIEAPARRLGIEPRPGSIERPDGSIGTWTMVGGPGKGDRPFFIQYDGDRPARWSNDQGEGIAWIEVAGDPSAIEAWIGASELDVRVVPGEPRLLSVGIRRVDGEVMIRW